ncbi:aminoacyl--tRNA ligase-related protein [Candidatus Vidania fulgoroideorum]
MRTSKYYFFRNTNSKNLVEKLGLNLKINGFYFYSPLGCLIIERIIKIIEKELNKNNIHKVVVPLLQNKEEFYKINKNKFKKEIYSIEKDNLILNPTCEEVFIKIFDKKIFKEKIEEMVFYNTDSKFRKEKRTDSLFKTREFIMTDIYSFCKNKKISEKNYNNVLKVFKKILDFFKINYKKKIKYREKNIRSVESLELLSLNHEIIHCFKLNKCYMTHNYINCFGIGISRLYNLIILKYYRNILKLLNIKFILIPTNYKNAKLIKYVEYIYSKKKNCLYDDRKINFKFKIENFENFFVNIIIVSNFCLKSRNVTFLKKKKKIDIKLKYFLKHFN